MNLDTLESISELIAAIGVVPTLIFFAIQIRQNTKAIRATSIQNLVQSLSENAQTWVENDSLIPIAIKANTAPEQLTEAELAKLHFMLVMAIRRFEGVYFQRSLGLVDNALVEGFERSHISIIASKSGRIWWGRSKEIFNSGFVKYVDQKLEDRNTKALHPVFEKDGE